MNFTRHLFLSSQLSDLFDINQSIRITDATYRVQRKNVTLDTILSSYIDTQNNFGKINLSMRRFGLNKYTKFSVKISHITE